MGRIMRKLKHTEGISGQNLVEIEIFVDPKEYKIWPLYVDLSVYVQILRLE